jgi:hypothetical protein
MPRTYRSPRPSAHRPAPSGLLVTFDGGRARIRILAADLDQQRRLEPLAAWIERILELALRRAA